MCIDTTKTVENALPPAARVLARPGGWIKFFQTVPRTDGSYAHCLLGAIGAAYGFNNTVESTPVMTRATEHSALVNRVMEAIPPEERKGIEGDNHPFCIIAQWNNDPKRTQQECVELLVKAGV